MQTRSTWRGPVVDLALFGLVGTLALLTLPSVIGLNDDGIVRFALFAAIVGLPVAILAFAHRRHAPDPLSSTES